MTCWQDDYLFSAFEFRQLIVKPCADVADLPAAIAGGLLGQSQPIDNLLRQMAGVIRLPFGSTNRTNVWHRHHDHRCGDGR